MAKISIIIPAFNVADFIAETLDTVLANRADMDIVVIDDASTDATCDIVETYMQRHGTIRLLRSETNTGPGVARNRALATIDSEYCLFHDADDMLNPGAIDMVLHLMDATNIDIAVFKYSLLTSVDGTPQDMASESRRIWDTVVGERDVAIVDIDVDAGAQFLVMVNYPWNKVYRTSFIRRVDLRFATARINEDILPHWAGYMHAGRFLAINRSLTVHRLIPGSAQHTNVSDERRLDIFPALREAEDLFEKTPVFREKYYHLFLYFKWGLLRWAFLGVKPELRGVFQEYVALSYRSFTDQDFQTIYPVMPDLALMTHRVKYAPGTLLD
jgi:glycosyltransferase involved in cell wall biosynthesis